MGNSLTSGLCCGADDRGGLRTDAEAEKLLVGLSKRRPKRIKTTEEAGVAARRNSRDVLLSPLREHGRELLAQGLAGEEDVKAASSTPDTPDVAPTPQLKKRTSARDLRSKVEPCPTCKCPVTDGPRLGGYAFHEQCFLYVGRRRGTLGSTCMSLGHVPAVCMYLSLPPACRCPLGDELQRSTSVTHRPLPRSSLPYCIPNAAHVHVPRPHPREFSSFFLSSSFPLPQRPLL